MDIVSAIVAVTVILAITFFIAPRFITEEDLARSNDDSLDAPVYDRVERI
jgi:hypothetical protein